MNHYIKSVLKNIPSDWLTLTTHRLDIFEENLAKTQFLEQFETLYKGNNSESKILNELPTSYDYIRLGHPLSCVLEWMIGKLNQINPNNIISFSSEMIPILAVLRKNSLEKKNTQIIFRDQLPNSFKAEILREVYGYKFELMKVADLREIIPFDGSTVFVSKEENLSKFNLLPTMDFYVNLKQEKGSIIVINGKKNESYISDIQHVRRRESIAMTPADCHVLINQLVSAPPLESAQINIEKNTRIALNSIKEITETQAKPLVASSGLSIQYAIMMGLIHDAKEKYPEKAIKFIVPPNCYGGTNDQARRVAAAIDGVEVVDLPVLKAALSATRKTIAGGKAIEPVFILDQTFCPNIHFLGEGEILSTVKAISYVSGSKFPSGGLCTAGYCVANKKAGDLIEKIETHLQLCDNEATPLQMEILANQLPSMKQRIKAAYKNTREFVTFIQEALPTAKINFVSEELANEGFTPSVFSLDLPTKGSTPEEKETYKRALNHKLIKLMISKIPNESKYCVSYGQLKGCYWTIPATSTQGTTKEGDKDYIARVALSPKMDMELHKEIFREFVGEI